MGKTGIVAILMGILLVTGYQLRVGKSLEEDEIEQPRPLLEMKTPIVVSESKTISIAVVGDIMLSRTVAEQMIKKGDWVWPFASTAAILAKAELTLGNLETPILPDCPTMTNRMIFCAEAESLIGLKAAGFDGVSLANNHTTNMGLSGLEKTEQLLEEQGIRGIKEGETEYLEIEGLRLGLITFDDVSKAIDVNEVYSQVASAAAETGMTMVIPHWGVEYVAQPNERQVEIGRKMIEAGADVVVGSHPHWTQTVERYKDKLIIYSLGNFVFDQMWSEETRQGEVAFLKCEVKEGKCENLDYELRQIKIYEYGQARWVEPEVIESGYDGGKR